MKVELPLLKEGSDATTAFESMKTRQRSAVVLKVGDGYQLIKAGAVFRAMKKSLDLTTVGQTIPIKDIEISLDKATVKVSDLVGVLFEHGPAACFCPNCDEAKFGPGQCPVCGTTVECH